MINVPRTFKSTPVIKMGLSDFHLMILTVMKKYFRKLQLRYINYWSYEDFYNEGFRKDLIRKVASQVFFKMMIVCKDFVVLTLKY